MYVERCLPTDADADPDPDGKRRANVFGHKLTGASKKLVTSRLLDCCVLGAMAFGSPVADSLRAFALQQAYLGQCERAIAARPGQKQVYARNRDCRPVGLVGPATKACRNPYACPWCFVRVLLLPIYETLLAPSLKPRNLSKLAVWKREVPYPAEELPLFHTECTPHMWCGAAVTVQATIPFVAPGTSTLQLAHVGFQLVPRNLNLPVALARDGISPVLESTEFAEVNEINVLTAIAATMRFPWIELFGKENVGNFTALVDGFDGKKPIRIDQDKSRPAQTNKSKGIGT